MDLCRPCGVEPENDVDGGNKLRSCVLFVASSGCFVQRYLTNSKGQIGFLFAVSGFLELGFTCDETHGGLLECREGRCV